MNAHPQVFSYCITATAQTTVGSHRSKMYNRYRNQIFTVLFVNIFVFIAGISKSFPQFVNLNLKKEFKDEMKNIELNACAIGIVCFAAFANSFGRVSSLVLIGILQTVRHQVEVVGCDSINVCFTVGIFNSDGYIDSLDTRASLALPRRFLCRGD